MKSTTRTVLESLRSAGDDDLKQCAGNENCEVCARIFYAAEILMVTPVRITTLIPTGAAFANCITFQGK